MSAVIVTIIIFLCWSSWIAPSLRGLHGKHE